MKKHTAIIAALATSVFTATAGTPAPPPVAVCAHAADPCAGPISYSNAELLYAYTDFDGAGDSADGVILRMEYGFMDHFYFTATGQYHDAGIIDMWSVSGGIGGYVPLSENIHLAADGGILWANYDVGSSAGSSANNGWSDDGVGWYVRPHIRAKFGCFEVHAGAQYSEVSDVNLDEWAVFADLYYQVSPGWDVTAGVAYSSERTTVTGGARYRF